MHVNATESPRVSASLTTQVSRRNPATMHSRLARTINLSGRNWMKRKLLPLLIAGLTAASANVALAGGPSLYGKINLSLNQYDYEEIDGGVVADELDTWRMESNASRLGVKGDFNISDSLKAIYKLEYEVAVDDGANSNGREFSQRNIYAGFQGSWGTLIAGKNDTPLKLAQGEVDRFNDYALGDINNFLVGENRENNIIMYTTPTVAGGLSLTLSAMPGEDSGTGTDDDDGLADATSIALTYMNDSFYAAIANDSNVDGQDVLRVVGEVGFGPVKIGALWQTAEEHDDGDALNDAASRIEDFGGDMIEQDGYLLSAEWKVAGPWKLKAQYGFSETTPALAGLDDVEATQMAIGVDYKLNDNSKVFAHYINLETEGEVTIGNETTEDSTFAVGYEIKF